MSYRISTAVPLKGLDGGGSVLAVPFREFLMGCLTEPCERAFEWCAGPGYIGLELLATGFCKTLVLADVNPAAVESARATVRENGLEDRVTVYLSDNLNGLPPDERFDLVVANPPNYHDINPKHPLGALLQDDLRPNDRGWALHRAFYAGIRKHLLPDAVLAISEVEPFDEQVFLSTRLCPYDIRPRAPIVDFKGMIDDGGLQLVDVALYANVGDVKLWMVVSTAGGQP